MNPRSDQASVTVERGAIKVDNAYRLPPSPAGPSKAAVVQRLASFLPPPPPAAPPEASTPTAPTVQWAPVITPGTAAAAAMRSSDDVALNGVTSQQHPAPTAHMYPPGWAQDIMAPQYMPPSDSYVPGSEILFPPQSMAGYLSQAHDAFHRQHMCTQLPPQSQIPLGPVNDYLQFDGWSDTPDWMVDGIQSSDLQSPRFLQHHAYTQGPPSGFHGDAQGQDDYFAAASFEFAAAIPDDHNDFDFGAFNG